MAESDVNRYSITDRIQPSGGALSGGAGFLKLLGMHILLLLGFVSDRELLFVCKFLVVVVVDGGHGHGVCASNSVSFPSAI